MAWHSNPIPQGHCIRVSIPRHRSQNHRSHSKHQNSRRRNLHSRCSWRSLKMQQHGTPSHNYRFLWVRRIYNRVFLDDRLHQFALRHKRLRWCSRRQHINLHNHWTCSTNWDWRTTFGRSSQRRRDGSRAFRIRYSCTIRRDSLGTPRSDRYYRHRSTLKFPGPIHSSSQQPSGPIRRSCRDIRNSLPNLQATLCNLRRRRRHRWYRLDDSTS